MIQTIYVTNPSASTLTLDMRDSGEDEGLIIFNMEGLGPPKATVTGVAGPNTEGIRASLIKIDARHIMITLAIPNSASEGAARQKIYDYFPIGKEIKFRVKTTGPKDIYTMAIVESNEMNQFAKVENAVISLFCPYPYFLHLTQQYASASDGDVTVTNNGEIVSGCDIIISFDGTVDDGLTIENANGTQSMYIDFAKMESGMNSCRVDDQIVINTRIGEKSILFWDDSTSTWFNGINGVGVDADWIKLFLGNNDISITTDDPPDLQYISELEVLFYPLYEGV